MGSSLLSSPLSRQDVNNLFRSKHAIAILSQTIGCPEDTVYIDQLHSLVLPQCCLSYLTFSTIDKLQQGEDMFSNGKGERQGHWSEYLMLSLQGK